MNFIVIFIFTIIAFSNFVFADADFIIWKRDSGFGLLNKTSLTSIYGTCDTRYFECSSSGSCCPTDSTCATGFCCPSGTYECNDTEGGCCEFGSSCLSGYKCSNSYDGGSGGSGGSKECSRPIYLILIVLILSIVRFI